MKYITIAFCVVLFACKASTKKTLDPPTDQQINELIKSIYTADNNLDGSEFATVDTVIIKEKKVDALHGNCVISFYIQCSYQPAATMQEYQQQRPTLKADTSITLVYENDTWTSSLQSN